MPSSTAQVKQGIGWGLVVLMGLMPLHAFVVISLGHWLGHQSVWAAWKEVLLLAMALATTYVAWRDKTARGRLASPIVYLGAAFVGIATLVTIIAHPVAGTAAYGLKTDFEFLLAAAIALVVADKVLVKRLALTLLAATAIVVTFALLQATILPRDLLTHVGYTFTPGTTAPYQTVVVGEHVATRFGSTLGGPNQLGTFLILPLCLSFLFGFKNRRWWILSVAIVPALAVTYSRGAWIGAVAALAIVIIRVAPAKRRTLIAAVMASGVVAIGLIAVIDPSSAPGRYLHHPALVTNGQNSDEQHLDSLQSGATSLLHAPLGHGLGTAGPATFHGGQTNIIENYYLQLGYETGIIGLGLFIGLVVMVCLTLLKSTALTGLAAGAAIVGISLTAIVLPAWTDSTTALTVWMLAGASLGVHRRV